MRQELKLRAEVFDKIRAFFKANDVLEVETPLLGTASIPDPNIQSFETTWLEKPLYLQTSPEFAMKQLLSKGSGCIFQLCKAFRNESAGRLHKPEFLMLEWYRVDMDYHALMREVEGLVKTILPSYQEAVYLSYQAAFEQHCGFNPHTASLETLKTFASTKKFDIDLGEDKDAWLDLILTHCIEPAFAKEDLLFIYDYPVTQAALAQVQDGVAQRFELYVRGVELANGFHELQDAKEQRQRFEAENAARLVQGLSPVPLDEAFLTALDSGLPDCSGVALGVDRLLMFVLAKNSL